MERPGFLTRIKDKAVPILDPIPEESRVDGLDYKTNKYLLRTTRKSVSIVLDLNASGALEGLDHIDRSLTHIALIGELIAQNQAPEDVDKQALLDHNHQQLVSATQQMFGGNLRLGAASANQAINRAEQIMAMRRMAVTTRKLLEESKKPIPIRRASEK